MQTRDDGQGGDQVMSIATFVMDHAPSATAALESAITSVFALPASSASSSPTDDPESQGECRLLGSFALLVQAALGGLALLALVYKRWRERPQRPLKVWFFDVSKQVFGSVLVHIANIFMSMLTSGRLDLKANVVTITTREKPYTPNPCSFYLLNLAIDTTVGIPILIILLRLTTLIVSYTPLGKPRESIQSGHYGNPPNKWWWLKQSVIYFIGLFGMKLCVLVIFMVFPPISKIGDWALSWTAGNEKLQIAFVMMIFPLIMNALQYYIIDNFIMNKENKDNHEHQPLPTEDPDDDGTYEGHHVGGDYDRNDDDDDDDEDAHVVEGDSTGRLLKNSSSELRNKK